MVRHLRREENKKIGFINGVVKCQVIPVKGAVLPNSNSAKLGNYKMPVKLTETKITA